MPLEVKVREKIKEIAAIDRIFFIENTNVLYNIVKLISSKRKSYMRCFVNEYSCDIKSVTVIN